MSRVRESVSALENTNDASELRLLVERTRNFNFDAELTGVKEMHQLASLLEDGLSTDVDWGRERQQAWVVRHRQRLFRNAMNKLRDAYPDPIDRAAKIADEIAEGNIRAERLPGRVAAEFMRELRDGGCFQEMVTLFDSSESPFFKKSNDMKELYAVAVHQLGLQTGDVGLLNRADGVLTEIPLDSYTADTYAVQAAVYDAISEISEKEGNTDDQELNSGRAISALQYGFSKKPGVDIGAKLAVKLLMNAETVDPEESQLQHAEKARRIAEVSSIIGNGDAVEYSGRPSGTRSMIIADVLAGTVKQSVILEYKRLLSGDSAEKQSMHLNELVQELENISVNASEFPDIFLGTEDACARALSLLQDSDQVDIPEDSLISKVMRKSMTYSRVDALVGGNVPYGGLLHDHNVTRWDRNVADAVLEQLGITDDTSFAEANNLIDGMLRNQNAVGAMENLTSFQHQVFDTAMHRLLVAMGFDPEQRSSEETATNVMLDLYLGIGDCRQNAYQKVVLLEQFKAMKLARVVEGLMDIDDEEFEKLKNDVSESANVHPLVLDAQVLTSVQTEGKYVFVRDDNGNLIPTGQAPENVEDHTLTALLKTADSGEARIVLADAFYQRHYQFGGHMEMDEQGELRGFELDAAAYLSEEGAAAGYVRAGNQEVPVFLKPVAYAGPLRGRHKPDRGSLGEPVLRGLPMMSGDTSSDIADQIVDRESQSETRAFMTRLLVSAVGEKEPTADTRNEYRIMRLRDDLRSEIASYLHEKWSRNNPKIVLHTKHKPWIASMEDDTRFTAVNPDEKNGYQFTPAMFSYNELPLDAQMQYVNDSHWITEQLMQVVRGDIHVDAVEQVIAQHEQLESIEVVDIVHRFKEFMAMRQSVEFSAKEIQAHSGESEARRTLRIEKEALPEDAPTFFISAGLRELEDVYAAAPDKLVSTVMKRMEHTSGFDEGTIQGALQPVLSMLEAYNAIDKKTHKEERAAALKALPDKFEHLISNASNKTSKIALEHAKQLVVDYVDANKPLIKAVVKRILEQGGRVVIGGEPVASPIMYEVEEETGLTGRIRIYQSMQFAQFIPVSVWDHPDIRMTRAAGPTMASVPDSLVLMRNEMIDDCERGGGFQGALFFAGRNGIPDEYAIAKGRAEDVRRIVIEGTGGEAELLETGVTPLEDTLGYIDAVFEEYKGVEAA